MTDEVHLCTPDMMSVLQRRLAPGAGAPVNPFSSPVPEFIQTSEILAGFFGIDQRQQGKPDRNATALSVRNESDSRLQVFGASQQSHQRIADLCRMYSEGAQGKQYLLTFKIGSANHLAAMMPGADANKGVCFNDPEFQVLMRKMSRMQGVDLVTEGNVIIRCGQRSVVEHIKEVPLPRADGYEFDWTGSRIDVEVSPRGEFIYVSGEIDFGTEEPGPRVRLVPTISSDGDSAAGGNGS